MQGRRWYGYSEKYCCGANLLLSTEFVSIAWPAQRNYIIPPLWTLSRFLSCGAHPMTSWLNALDFIAVFPYPLLHLMHRGIS